MKENKHLFLNYLTKSENVKNKKKDYFRAHNENNLVFPKMNTMNKISRNFSNNFNISNQGKLYNKTSTNFGFKTEQNFFKDNLKNFKYQYLLKKLQKYYNNENIKIKIKENKEEFKDYSIIMKHLEKWDKEHCYKNKDKSDITLLFRSLINYYKDNNLINEEKNLYNIENMLKEKPGFKQFLYNGYLNQNNLLKELIMRSPTRRKMKEEKQINEDRKCLSDKKFNEDGFINLLKKKN